MTAFALRAWTDDPDDLAFLYDMYSRPEVRRYIGDGSVMSDPDEPRRLVARWAALADGPFGARALETADGEQLGSILLKHIPWSAGAVEAETPEDVEIGWHLHPDAWGRGFASAGARAVLREAWAAGVQRVVAVTHPDNAASQRVCARIGMTPRGRTRQYYDTECALFDIRA
jgi:RimJ/RimL family protein N-acetyltransferase